MTEKSNLLMLSSIYRNGTDRKKAIMARMRTWTYRQMVEVVEQNGYSFCRCSGDHMIFKKEGARNTITLAKKRQINPCIARRLIKENNLILN